MSLPVPEWTIAVSCFGICTHIHPEMDRETHRVVLVNASDKKRIDAHPAMKDRGINEHDATLQILRSDLRREPEARPWLPIIFMDATRVVWKLDGVFLSTNGVRTVEGPRTPPECIPHLGEYCGPLPLPAPRDEAEGLETAADTACIFQYPSCPYVGESHNPDNRPDGGAAVGVLTIGFTALPVLHAAGFTGGELSIDVQPGAEITISNIPKIVTLDKDADFLLHFLALSNVPEGARYPGEDPGVPIRTCSRPWSSKNPPIHIGDVSTPGCSNSNYP